MDSIYQKKESFAKRNGSSFFQDSISSCTSQALVYLSMREHNRKEITTKLKTKGYSDPIIKETLDNLEENNLLSEIRYIQVFIRSNNKRHPEGKSILLQRLIQKGANKDKVKEVLDELYDDSYTKELVQSARLKLLKKKKELNENEINTNLKKLGFTSRDIKESIE